MRAAMATIAGSSSGRIGRRRNPHAIGEGFCRDEIVRVGPDGEPRSPRHGGALDPDPGVETDRAELVGEERVDIELGDFGNIRNQLREPDQNIGDGLDLHRRLVAIAVHQARDAGARQSAPAPD